MNALRAFITIGLAALWLCLFAPPMFQTPPTVVPGVHPMTAWNNVVRVDAGSPAYRAGIRTGDDLRCLSPRDAALLLSTVPQGFSPGTEVSACVRRGSMMVPVRFVPEAGPPLPNSYGSTALIFLRIAIALVFSIVGITLVMLKPNLTTWLFYFYCLCDAPSWAAETAYTTYPNWLYLLLHVPLTLTSFMGVPVLLLFTIVVPDEVVPMGWRRIAFYAGTGVSALAAAAMLLSMLDPNIPNQIDNYAIDNTFTTVTVLTLIARLFTMRRDERARFGWAAFAIVFGVVMSDLRNVLSESSNLLSTIAADLTIVMPLVMVYAILKRHVIDVRFAISRAVVYGVLTTAIVGIIGAVDWLTSAYLSQVRLAMAVDAAVTIGLAFVLHRAYDWIESVVDYVLYRHKHDAESYLKRMAKTLLRAKREETIDHAVVQAPKEKLDLTHAALFRARGNVFAPSVAFGWHGAQGVTIDEEHELVRFLATERTKLHLSELRSHVADEFRGESAPAVAIPLFQADDLVAFAVYGIHRDGTKLDPDEIETLEHLCELAAQAYTAIELARYRALPAITQPA